MAEPEPARGGAGSPKRSQPVELAAVIPIVVPLLTLLYNSDAPRLFGFPVFYWLQFAFILVGVATTSLVYQMTRTSRGRPTMSDHITEIIVFALLFLLVSGMGFVAARWRAPKDMAHLDEWGLGGRSFGGWITWFLVGGDLYTAYTFVAVPALMFGAGAAGFFAVPYTVVIYPLFFLVLIRLWSVSHRHGFVTPADFVRTRFDSPTLALLIAITGIVATMPYIALQLVGIEAVLKTMGVTGDSAARPAPADHHRVRDPGGVHVPVRAAGAGADRVRQGHADLHRDHRGGHLPAVQAGRLGRHLRRRARPSSRRSPAPGDGILLNANNQLQYITLALGSALALFLYPHSITGVLASKNRNVIKRNMSALPAYSLLLGADRAARLHGHRGRA